LGAFSSLLGVAFFLNSPNMTTSRGRVLVAFVELDRPCESCAVMLVFQVNIRAQWHS
jgi:hypothetical protein